MGVASVKHLLRPSSGTISSPIRRCSRRWKHRWKRLTPTLPLDNFLRVRVTLSQFDVFWPNEQREASASLAFRTGVRD